MRGSHVEISAAVMTMPTDKPLGLNHRSNENRRASKPLMEKRRRARINHSLAELKSLILDAVKRESQNTRHSKLEKADILEMTVLHLQNLHRQKLTASLSPDSNAEGNFRAGYSECAREVSRFVAKADSMDPLLRSRLLAHLSTSISNLSDVPRGGGGEDSASTSSESQTPSPLTLESPAPPCSPVNITLSHPDSSSVYSNSSSPHSSIVPSPPPPPASNHLGGVPLIASRLPNGQFAFILPGAYVDTTAQCYPSGPLDLATGSNQSTCSTPATDSESSALRPQETDHVPYERDQMVARSPLHEDPVWRPW